VRFDGLERAEVEPGVAGDCVETQKERDEDENGSCYACLEYRVQG